MKHRTDLKGMTVKGLDLQVEHAVEFEASGTFQAFYKAEAFLRELGYTTGSMEMNAPIGFSLEYDYISKWNNMNHNEHRLLDGIMTSNDFREGSVQVLFFKAPNF
jgi:hypothetical protein